MKKNAKWENWVNLMLGFWIFIVPWVFSENLSGSAMTSVRWNFWFVGIVIVVAALLAIQNIRPWEEWTNLVAGLWLFFSPWTFAYASDSALLWNSLIVGIVVTILSGIALPIAQKLNQQPL